MTRSPRSGAVTTAAPDRRGRDDRGIAAVEFALIAPVLLALLVGIVVAGTTAVGHLRVQSAARDGARAGSVDPGTGCTLALGRLDAMVGATSCTTIATCPGTNSTISVTATQTVTIPLIGDRTVNLDATATFECQSSGGHDHHD